MGCSSSTPQRATSSPPSRKDGASSNQRQEGVMNPKTTSASGVSASPGTTNKNNNNNTQQIPSPLALTSNNMNQEVLFSPTLHRSESEAKPIPPKVQLDDNPIMDTPQITRPSSKSPTHKNRMDNISSLDGTGKSKSPLRKGASSSSSSSSPPSKSSPIPIDSTQTNNNNSNHLDRERSTSQAIVDETVVLKKIKAHRVVFSKAPEEFGAEDQSSRKPSIKTESEKQCILRALDLCYFFSDATNEQKYELASYMWKKSLKVGAPVVDAASGGSESFYIVESGSFELLGMSARVPVVVTSTSPEPFFGQLSLAFDDAKPSSMKCSAAGPNGFGTLWVIDRSTCRSILAKSATKSREEKKNAVNAIPMLQTALSEEQRNRVIDAIHLVEYAPGQRIVRKGDRGDICYFIREGSVECTRIGDSEMGSVQLGPGQYFGERALLKDEPRAADVTAITRTLVMALDRNSFIEVLGPLRSLMDENMKGRVVESLPILHQLTPEVRRDVVSKFELETFPDNSQIIKRGEEGNKFYVVRDGIVEVFSSNDTQNRSNYITTLREGDWFGEMALLNDEPRGATCIAKGTVECFTLSRADFQIIKGRSSLLAATSAKRQEMNQRQEERDRLNSVKQLELDQFEKVTILGRGTFGTVYLVQAKPSTISPGGEESLSSSMNHSSNDQHQHENGANNNNNINNININRAVGYWALKMLNKKHIVECDQKSNVLNEKAVLSELDHPFVVTLVKTFKDPDNLYMLMEYVPGGELFSIMQEKFKLPLGPTRFYSACIVDVFDYMHRKNIIYRDLKPENILIDRLGYIKVADFGFAKRVHDKTFTLCGTPEYLAPEVVLGKGHDKGVDYWGIGVLIFEMLVGISPFADEYDDDQMIVCNNIVKGRVDFDRLVTACKDVESKAAKDSFWDERVVRGENPFAGDTTSVPSTLTTVAAAPENPPEAVNFLRRLSRSRSRADSSASGTLGNSSGVIPAQGKIAVKNVEDIVKKFLMKNPHQRLGCLRAGAEDIHQHPFFSCVYTGDWSELGRRRYPAPYIPVLKSESDTSRFDSFSEPLQRAPYTGNNKWCANF